MAKTQSLENVILFARAGFRGINDLGQVETIMASVVEALDGTDLMVDGKAVGSISNARIEGSLIRGDVEITNAAFLATDAGTNLCRRIAASYGKEVRAEPAPKAAAKPAAKKAVVKAAEPEEQEEEQEQEPAIKKPVAKTVGKPVAKPAPGKGKPVVPMNKKIKVNL
jgi:hypothetical protein